MELKIGYLLKRGEYRIERVLGQGGFGITYLAEQVSLDRKVAVKEFFMKELCNREGDTSHVTVPSIGSREMVDRFRDKFIKEARALAKLRHRHIVRIIDVFEENNTAYYVMEHIGGGSLGDKVKSGALPEEDAVCYIRQVASALDFVHSRRMMHLDVKPANVLLSDDNDAVLIDFGLAKQYDDAGEQTSSTPVGISHGYAPMEQYKRGGVGTFSPATDIYSLGATLYKLVTGITPPEANDVANDGLPELPQHLSSNVRAAIEAAMQFRLKDRPQSIGEFLEIVESGEVKDGSGEVRDERGEMKDGSDGVEDCPSVLRGTSAAEGVNDSPSTDDGETVVDNHANPVILSASEPSVDARRGQSQGTHKHAKKEILPPSGRQNDNGGKLRDESGEVKDERKGLGGTSKKRWAIIIAVLVIGAVAALLGTMSGGGSSNDYEGKLVPILDNSNDKWGYADTLGNIVVEPQYDRAYSFSDGLSEVRKDGKSGFIDKTGRVVIGLQYDDTFYFSEGLAEVEKDDKWGFIDKTGRVVIGLQYDGTGSFSEGLAAVRKDDKWGFIDKTGRVVIEPQYDYVGYFSEGLAAVRKDDKYGFIDKTGKVVVKPQCDNTHPFSEGLAWVLKDGKSGFIDKTGKVVVRLLYDFAYPFSEGLAVVMKNDKHGFIDKTGRVVLGLQYDSANSFSEGLAPVRKDGKSCFIDKTGRVVIGLQYDYAHRFSEGLAAVKKDGKWGYIDKTGRVVIEPQYDSAHSFSDGLAEVEKNGKEFFIDKTGREYIKW